MEHWHASLPMCCLTGSELKELAYFEDRSLELPMWRKFKACCLFCKVSNIIMILSCYPVNPVILCLSNLSIMFIIVYHCLSIHIYCVHFPIEMFATPRRTTGNNPGIQRLSWSLSSAVKNRRVCFHGEVARSRGSVAYGWVSGAKFGLIPDIHFEQSETQSSFQRYQDFLHGVPKYFSNMFKQSDVQAPSNAVELLVAKKTTRPQCRGRARGSPGSSGCQVISLWLNCHDAVAVSNTVSYCIGDHCHHYTSYEFYFFLAAVTLGSLQFKRQETPMISYPMIGR